MLYDFTISKDKKTLTVYEKQNGFSLEDIAEFVSDKWQADYAGHSYKEEFTNKLLETLKEEAPKNVIKIDLNLIDELAFETFTENNRDIVEYYAKEDFDYSNFI